MAKSAGAFTGGKLNLKGDKRKPKKKSKNTKHGEPSEGDRVAKSSASSAQRDERSNHNASSGSDDDGYYDDKKKSRGDDSDEEDLTAAEKRSLKFKLQRERKELEQVVRCVLTILFYILLCSHHSDIQDIF